jgi:protein tyrosine/serine phosphatase
LLGAHASFLQAADEVILQGWGSFDAYLEDMGGLDRQRREALATHMIAI